MSPPTITTCLPKAKEGAEDSPHTDPRVPEAFYDAERKEYLLKNNRGVYLSLTESQFKRHLRSAGISSKATEGSALSAADETILEVQNQRDVHYSGRLCGQPEGFCIKGQTRVLVTEGLNLPEPAPGAFPMIRSLIHGLLRNDALHGETQVDVFLAWLKLGVSALRQGQIQAAQALGIAGPPGCGKSLAQSLITEILGGRAAKPHRYMTGSTDFNGELFEAEHLVLEDEFMSRKISDRLKLGASIKSICVSSRTQSCHRKNRQAITLPAWWRLSITLNDDPEAMLVLPPLDEHVADKIILLRASRFEFPMPMDSAEAQEKFMDACKAEVPAFLHWLLNHYVIPETLAEPRRYGVVSWQHPLLKADLDSLSPEADLLALLDEVLWDSPRTEWRGTSEELQRLLFEDHTVAPQARRLLEYRNAAGTYLGRLANKPTARVRECRTATRREYVILPPPK